MKGNESMKNKILSILLFIGIVLAGCVPQVTTNPPENSGLPTTTPEVFMPLTQVVPAQVQFEGITLAVQEAKFGHCGLPDCPSAPVGRRYLIVILQAINLAADQSLDYKNLPQGIAIQDNMGTTTPFAGLASYSPATQQLVLYFAVSEDADVFGLQWPNSAEIPLAVTQSEVTATEPSTSPLGTEVTFGQVTLLLPPEIANGASGREVHRVDSPESAWYLKAPAHLEILLGDYYVLQGKSIQPLIEVYPAQEYAQLAPAAFESMHRLDNILGNPGAVINAEQLPAIPFFNDLQAFAANIQVVSFQNGQGVRFLTEYGQAPPSANNHDLFYEFQGLTSDGSYYIVAVFPIATQGLGESADPADAVPVEGIAFPNMGDPNADWKGYYAAVVSFLDATPPDNFTPTINQLDALVQSIKIAP
jgi:hypothetical protein